MFGMHVYDMIWQNSSNVFRLNAFYYYLLSLKWETYNLAKATGFHSFFPPQSSDVIIFLFVYIMRLLAHSTLHLLFIFLWECSGEFMQFDLGCICADGCLSSSFSIPLFFSLRWLFSLLHCRSPLPFFLSLCLKIKTTFRGDREIDHVDKRSAWLQPWRCGSSFSLSLYSPRDKLLISSGSMIMSCIQFKQVP